MLGSSFFLGLDPGGALAWPLPPTCPMCSLALGREQFRGLEWPLPFTENIALKRNELLVVVNVLFESGDRNRLNRIMWLIRRQVRARVGR